MRSRARDRTDAKGGKGRRPRVARQEPPGRGSELVSFVLQNKRWWLTPTIMMLLLLSLLAALNAPGVAPFIYVLD
jgi:hypothetical protein